MGGLRLGSTEFFLIFRKIFPVCGPAQVLVTEIVGDSGRSLEDDAGAEIAIFGPKGV